MSNELNNSILRLLECPVCMNYMSKPIVSCAKGHSLCSNCGKRISICPSCKQMISLSTRNYGLEAVCELLEYPCIYADSGCPQLNKFNEINNHCTTCSYRPYPCMLGKCNWKGSRFQLTAHALLHHKDKISVINSNNYTWNKKRPLYEMITTYNEVFLLHRKLVKSFSNKSTMYWAIQYVGKAEDRTKFYYKLHISCEEYEHRRITFTECCCDDLKTIKEIIADDDFYVAIPLPLLESYQNKNEEVFYEVTIYM